MSLTKLEEQYRADRRAGKMLDPVPGFSVSTPYKATGPAWGLGYHTGEDYACPAGTPVVAVTWGHVIGVGWGGAPHGLGSDYGNVVLIEKASGDLEYFYAHLSRFNVHLGERVMPGQVLGWSGYTGHVLPVGPGGAHCHFEARPLNGSFGSDVDPIRVKKRSK